jgi:hypothetical protein
MKHPADNLTVELPGFVQAKKRGRPASGNAMTAAERMRRYREGLKASTPNEEAVSTTLKSMFTTLDRFKDAEAYYQIKGAITALNWSNIIKDDQADRAKEWAYCVWKQNNFKR